MSDPYIEENTPLLVEFTKTEEGLQPVSALSFLNRDELKEKSNKAIDKAMSVIQDVAGRVNSLVKEIKEDLTILKLSLALNLIQKLV